MDALCLAGRSSSTVREQAGSVCGSDPCATTTSELEDAAAHIGAPDPLLVNTCPAVPAVVGT